ncbi:MAG: DUF3991 domain-containing protein [Deltaproteobacteria bacterium]|jgi:hypothetical protein|nr:DUF3991 domain-containing protein [Deltaproteobacteria bacterium]
MIDRFETTKKKAQFVRNIELHRILEQTGAVRDKNDPAKWHTGQGILCVNGQKFFNWTKNVGGGGAIDLINHLHQVDFMKAVAWLTENFASSEIQVLNKAKSLTHQSLVLPQNNPKELPQITRYLTTKRCLPQALIQSLIDTGNLYADNRANAVFLLLGKEKTIVGAEIRGTTDRIWHALAPGSKKDRGFFYVKNKTSQKVVLCESAIDALSYYALVQDCIVISTAGAHPNPPWLSSLIKRGLKVFCGFDADKTGDLMAEQMNTLYPVIERLRPPKHDWNDVLKYR